MASPPRRVSASSNTSSWIKEATWIISVTWPSRDCRSKTSSAASATGSAFARSMTIVGRKRFPCLFSKKCAAASESSGFDDCTSIFMLSEKGSSSSRTSAKGSGVGGPFSSSITWPCGEREKPPYVSSSWRTSTDGKVANTSMERAGSSSSCGAVLDRVRVDAPRQEGRRRVLRSARRAAPAVRAGPRTSAVCRERMEVITAAMRRAIRVGDR
mmetsp:Transcript_7934/g.23633  ORF Transcript_7934/g.23633 Transcript_7934/m.23633 type:complete len:213 (-) Transcript_7934:98-736(-)